MLKYYFSGQFLISLWVAWLQYQGVCLCQTWPARDERANKKDDVTTVSKKYKFHICISQKNQRNTREKTENTSCICEGVRVSVSPCPPPPGREGANNADNVTAKATVRAKDLPESASYKTPWSEIKVSEQTNLPNLDTLQRFVFLLDFVAIQKIWTWEHSE